MLQDSQSVEVFENLCVTFININTTFLLQVFIFIFLVLANINSKSVHNANCVRSYWVFFLLSYFQSFDFIRTCEVHQLNFLISFCHQKIYILAPVLYKDGHFNLFFVFCTKLHFLQRSDILTEYLILLCYTGLDVAVSN